MWLSKESLVPRAKSSGRTREVEARRGDSSSVAGEFGTCPVQDCKNALCFENFGAVAKDEWVVVSQSPGTVTEKKTKETGAMDRLEEGGDGELNGLPLGPAGKV